MCIAQVNTDSLETILPKLEGKQRIITLNDLCWGLGISDPEKVENYGKESITLSKKNNYDTLLAQAYNDLGTLYIRIGKYDKATKLLDSCILKRTVLKDSLGIAKVISKLAVIDEIRSDYSAALEKNIQILKIFESIGKDRIAIATLYGNISVIFYNMSQFEKSIEFNDKCYQIGVEENNIRIMSTALINYGNAYSKKGEYRKALNYFEKALPLSIELKDKHATAVNFNNLGSIYANMYIYDSAAYFLNKSLTLREEINDLKGIMSTKTSLGNIFRSQKKYNKAIDVLNDALKVSTSLKTKENTKSIYFNLAQVYHEMGNDEMAYINHVKFSDIKDSIWSDKSSKIVAEMETKYESEKKDAAIEILNKENALEKEKVQRQQLVLYGTGLGIFLLLGLSFTIYKSYAQKKKANDIITEQNKELNQYNEEILAQRDEIEMQKHKVEEAHTEIRDSITYAKRIQQAILPSNDTFNEYLPDSFVLYKPKDVVAGDFYWVQKKGDIVLFAAADCTGHGVPGAMVSVVCNNALNRSVREYQLLNPGKILDKTREIVVAEFSKSDKNVSDGMDICLCALNIKSMKLQYSGANNPLWLVRKGELIEIKADKYPIGKSDMEVNFATHEIDVEKGDWVYSFSDGYLDQFGGPNNKRFGSKQFKDVLAGFSGQDADLQKSELIQTITEWMNQGNELQIDDICILGVKI